MQPDFEIGAFFGMRSSEQISSFGTVEIDKAITCVFAKTVRKIGKRFVNIEAQFRNFKKEKSVLTTETTETNNSFTLEGDYYINPGLSLGGGFVINRGQDRSHEGTAFAVRGRYDHPSQFGVVLSAERFMARDSTVDDRTTIRISVEFRY